MPDDMSHQIRSDAIQARRRARARRRLQQRLKLFGAVLLLAALCAAIFGILARLHKQNELAAWTNAQAEPTVQVAYPDPSQGDQHLVLPGDVQAFYEAPIYARVSGYLRSWSADIGAHVRRGEILGVIETPDLDQQLAQANADLATARARADLAELTYRRWHHLLASNSVSQQSADEKQGDYLAQKAEVAAQLAHVSQLEAMESFKRLAAPFDGVVTARNTDVGALINSGASAATPLFKVADMHAMRIYVRVPQAYVSQLRTGMRASLTQPQYPGQSFAATLTTTSQSAALESRTVLAELMAPNPDGKLWPGTYAQVDFALPPKPGVLRVPASALIFRAAGAQLATVDGDDRIAMKPVEIGENLGDQIEILSGVSRRDRVVTTPLDTLENGEKVEVAQARPDPVHVAGATQQAAD